MPDTPSLKQKTWLANLAAVIFFLLLSFFFSLPLLKDLTVSCRGDWDYACHLYEVASITLFEYGELPLWNPYTGGGLPLIGNPHVGPSPISLLTSLFGVLPGLKIAVWLHTFLGLQGNWLLGRHLGIRGPASFAPPVIFMFCSAWTLHLAEGHITWLPASLTPLLFLCFLKGLKDRRWLLAAALLLSVMFYEGGTYVLAFILLFMAVYAVTLSLQERSCRPLLAFCSVGLFAAGFSAPKLLPVLSQLGGHPRLLPAGDPVPWSDLVGSFIDRCSTLGVLESGCYLGVVVTVLYLWSLFRVKGQLPLAVASLTLLSLSLGNFASWAPWTLLHALPLFSSFQVPTRSLIVFTFSASLMVGLVLGRRDGREPRWMAFCIGMMVTAIAADLLSLDRIILAEAAKPVQPFFFRLNGPMRLDKPAELYHVSAAECSALGRSVPSLHRPFSQVRVPDLYRFAHGGWSDQYPHLLQNRGVVDAYETFPFDRNVHAAGDALYRGEFHLAEPEKGEVLLKKWSPNKLLFHVALKSGNLLVVNQNYWSGWRVSRGELKRSKGLLSVQLGPGEYDVELAYLPGPFVAGSLLCLATVALAFMRLRPRSGRRQSRLHP